LCLSALLGFPNRVRSTRFHRVVFNDWGTSCPCLLPPMAAKSKPPALRVVVDSGWHFSEGILARFHQLCQMGQQLKDWVFSNPAMAGLHPHRLRHYRTFVFFRLWRKNPSHPLSVWSVTHAKGISQLKQLDTGLIQ